MCHNTHMSHSIAVCLFVLQLLSTHSRIRIYDNLPRVYIHVVYNWLYCIQLAILYTTGYTVYNWLYCIQLAILYTTGYTVYNWLYCILYTGNIRTNTYIHIRLGKEGCVWDLNPLTYDDNKSVRRLDILGYY